MRYRLTVDISGNYRVPLNMLYNENNPLIYIKRRDSDRPGEQMCLPKIFSTLKTEEKICCAMVEYSYFDVISYLTRGISKNHLSSWIVVGDIL